MKSRQSKFAFQGFLHYVGTKNETRMKYIGGFAMTAQKITRKLFWNINFCKQISNKAQYYAPTNFVNMNEIYYHA